MKRTIILPDIHLTTTIPKPYQTVKKFIKSYKPDEIILLGDFMDCSALSHWDKDKRRLMEGLRYKKEIATANEELDFLQKYTKSIVYLEGNHEAWVEQYLDRNPEFEGLIELPKQLNLVKRGIRWLKYHELYKSGHCYFTHGMFTNKYHANKHLTTLGCNVVYGHVHRPQVDMMNMKMQNPIKAIGLGCLCGHEPHYLKGRFANWMNGFGIMESDKKGTFNFYNVDVINNKFLFGGKKWE